MIKKLIIIFCALLAFLIISYMILPKPLYEKATWTQLADGGSRKFQFSKYALPEEYKMLSYRQGMEDRKSFVLFQNQTNNQYYTTFILRELPKVNFDKIRFENKKIARTAARYYTFDVATDPNFELIYLTPFLINEDYSEKLPSVDIRDIKVESKEEFETEKTKVLLVNGTFRELGFYRVSKKLFVKYPVPVFSFKKYPMNGALAIINNKSTEETIFAFGCVEFDKKFNKDEFIEIVKSVTFDKEPRSLRDLFGTETVKKHSK